MRAIHGPSCPVVHRACGVLTLLGLVLACVPAQASQLFDHSIELTAGWNAVYLEVDPQDSSPAAVFANLPATLTLESAWTWDSGAAIQFIRDSAEAQLAQPGWRVHYPADSPDDPGQPNPAAFLSNLHAVLGQRAYLLKLRGTGGPVAWTVTGRPSLRPTRWTADSFNLMGFPVDPAAPPSFASYFAPSAAHAGQDVYRLLPSGQWQRITDLGGATVASGQAYYVYSDGGSSYAGPLDLELEQGDGLDFGDNQNQFQIRMRNLSSTATTLSVGLTTAGAVPLAYRLLSTVADPSSPGDTMSQITWPALPATLSQPAPAGQDVFLRLAVDRSAIASPPAESVLQMTDGLGTRRLLAVVADAPASSRRVGRATALPAGLWVGAVTLDGVNEAQGDPNQAGFLTTTPAQSSSSLRLIVHIDGSGQARLLKSVVMMWKDGTLVPDPNNPGFQTVGTPGRYVLLTDDSLIPDFAGASLRDGDPVGFRVSAVSYDFDEPAAAATQMKNTLKMTGTFDVGETLSAMLTISPNHPTNPFLHRYHPDHDNFDARGIALNPDDPNNPRPHEAFGFTRNVSLAIYAADPLATGGTDRFDWKTSRLEGTYKDTITGVHKNGIVVTGTFSLLHSSGVDVLNQ